MNEIGQWISDDTYYVGGKVLLELGGRIILNTDADLALQDVAARVGDALGIVFGEDREGIYEETYALTTEVCDQRFSLYREEAQSMFYPGRIVLEVREWVDTRFLDLHHESEYRYLLVNIAEHVAALLRKRTGLPFIAHQPGPGVLF